MNAAVHGFLSALRAMLLCSMLGTFYGMVTGALFGTLFFAVFGTVWGGFWGGLAGFIGGTVASSVKPASFTFGGFVGGVFAVYVLHDFLLTPGVTQTVLQWAIILTPLFISTSLGYLVDQGTQSTASVIGRNVRKSTLFAWPGWKRLMLGSCVLGTAVLVEWLRIKLDIILW